MAEYRPLQRVTLARGQIKDVYRFVHTGDLENEESLVADFRSDRERGRPQRGRSVATPELYDGMSVFRTLDLARDRWQVIAKRAHERGEPVRIGEFIARVQLEGEDLSYEDLGDPDGHMTLWGDPVKLASCVVQILRADQ